MVVIDPGPDMDSHVRALSLRMESAEQVTILLTHGHRDHAEAALTLAELSGATICGPEGLADYGVERIDRVLYDGDTVDTDAGALEVVHTPGHTPEHICFHWSAHEALFAGDLVLGEGDTTWVAEYPGCVADYLDSIARVRGLNLSVVYPAHGPPLTDPPATWDRFEGHRRARIQQLRTALEQAPDAGLEELLGQVYGDRLPASMRGAASQSLSALVDYVNGVRSTPAHPPRN